MKTNPSKINIALRQVKMLLGLISLLFGNMAFSCTEVKDVSSNGCTSSYETIKTLTDATGIIAYDVINEQYTINIYIKETIDEIITLYPCKLNEEYRKINLPVKISGQLFLDQDIPKPQVGGQEIFRIDISSISKTN